MFYTTKRHYVNTDHTSTAMEETDTEKDVQVQTQRIFYECFCSQNVTILKKQHTQHKKNIAISNKKEEQ
jgi:hypothetical protein